MKIERTKNAVKNITMGVILRIYQTIVPFLMRTAMIHFMGVQYLGLNSLFKSVLHVLNLAELGVGVAMVYSMYKPIAEDDEAKICALMKLYRRYYRLIGLFIGVVGLALTPMIPRLISGDVPPELNVYVLYLLNLGATVLTYWLFAYKNCLLQAHQRSNITSLIAIITYTLQFALQLIVIIWWKNYYAYLMILLATTILNNLITAAAVSRIYPRYKPQGILPKDEIRVINGKIRDLFTGKLGAVVIGSADTIVISAHLGLTVLAVYQNYYFILGAITAIVEILMGSITAGLGNSFITETKEKNYRDLEKFSFMLMWVGGMCACCFLGMYQPFMEIWVGKDLMLGFAEVVCFAAYFFQFALYRLLNVYKDAAGLWHEDRFRPLTTAMVNLGLNLWWVRSMGVFGVILSTIVSQIFVAYPWLLRNLFTLFFDRSLLRPFCKGILKCAGATVLAGVIVSLICCQISCPVWPRLILCAIISVIVPNLLHFALFRKTEHFRQSLRFADRITKGKLSLERRLVKG